MIRKYYYPAFLLLLAYLLFSSNDAKVIFAGIAIFLIGMVFMEDGFKLFSGGILEKVLEKSTNNVPKAIGTGFIATAIIQSSSLVSIIIISFLSAELISLSGAIGVVFGSNIGTTATSWIVSAFGVKIKIAHYAMPMIIFGVIFRFSKEKSYQGLGNVLVGLGFVFLGIGYMKEGFETLKNGLDLAEFAMEGYLGVLVYILIGAAATIIIQSSSATMALIITALATNQIMYINAIELAIGANIGTTVTAVIGAMASNANGKRLAVAHFIFNMTTGAIAIIFLHQLSEFVSYLSSKIGIGATDYAMQLALFHTIFNLLGVLTVSPFTSKLVKFLEGLFKDEKISILKAKYLDDAIIEVPHAAMAALKKELEYLYDNATEVLSHALYLHRHKFFGHEDISEIVKRSDKDIKTNIDEFYNRKIKSLYSEIIKYATLAQDNMNEEERIKVNHLRLASRNIVEAIKDIRDIQRNIQLHLKSKNEKVKEEYNHIRVNIAKVIDGINTLRTKHDDLEVLSKIELLKEETKEIDMLASHRIDTLIRNKEIDSKAATSLINDSALAHDISKKLLEMATILWIEEREVQELGDEL